MGVVFQVLAVKCPPLWAVTNLEQTLKQMAPVRYLLQTTLEGA